MRTHFLQHASFEAPGYLLQWAQQQQHTISCTRLYEAPDFPPVEDIDWLVVMGGPMGVYDEDRFPWLKQEKAFLQAVIRAGKKVLGVCLGSQLVAEALGARVYPHTEKEIGWWPVEKVNNEMAPALAQLLPDSLVPFHWHGDTFDLPAHATHLLKTALCPHQAFIYDNRVMGLQFHLEATPELVADMVAHGKEELQHKSRGIQPEAVILQNKAHYAANHACLERLLEWFLQEG